MLSSTGSFFLIYGTPIPGLQSMLGLISMPAIASLSIFLMPLKASTQKHVPENFWNGGTGTVVISYSSVYGPHLLFIREVFPNGGTHAQPSKSTSHKALEAQRAAREGS
jgi:hypothetical protein